MRVDLGQFVSPAETASLRPAAPEGKPVVGSKPPAAPVQKPQPAPPTQEAVTVFIDHGRKMLYRVVDPETGDVISQLPSEEVLRVAQNIADMLDARNTEGAHNPSSPREKP